MSEDFKNALYALYNMPRIAENMSPLCVFVWYMLSNGLILGSWGPRKAQNNVMFSLSGKT